MGGSDVERVHYLDTVFSSLFLTDLVDAIQGSKTQGTSEIGVEEINFFFPLGVFWMENDFQSR